MTAKHSPGPWRWVANSGGYHTLETPEGFMVADDGSASGEYGGWMHSPDEPNAHLIALAPELLAMLMEAAQTLERCRYSEQHMARKCRELIARCTV